MTQETNLSKQSAIASPAKPMLIGAAIGLILISLFVFGVDNPKPEWGNLWRIRPLIITPLAGAMGGLVFYFMMYMSSRGRINKTLAYILAFIVSFIGLWLGVVLGLDGTMWD